MCGLRACFVDVVKTSECFLQGVMQRVASVVFYVPTRYVVLCYAALLCCVHYHDRHNGIHAPWCATWKKEGLWQWPRLPITKDLLANCVLQVAALGPIGEAWRTRRPSGGQLDSFDLNE